MKKLVCVAGIDTDVGKTVVTGMLAKSALSHGIKVITQKIVQTGCDKISDDILVHRKIMGINVTEYDDKGLTCPYIFEQPCSPHLAAKLEGQEIDPAVIRENIDLLSKEFELVLLEGAGGLYVPLNDRLVFLDFLSTVQAGLILVSTNKVGSINHTLLAIDAIKKYNLDLKGIVYNRYYDVPDVVSNDTKEVIKAGLVERGFPATVVELLHLQANSDQIPVDITDFLDQKRDEKG